MKGDAINDSIELSGDRIGLFRGERWRGGGDKLYNKVFGLNREVSALCNKIWGDFSSF